MQKLTLRCHITSKWGQDWKTAVKHTRKCFFATGVHYIITVLARGLVEGRVRDSMGVQASGYADARRKYDRDLEEWKRMVAAMEAEESAAAFEAEPSLLRQVGVCRCPRHLNHRSAAAAAAATAASPRSR